MTAVPVAIQVTRYACPHCARSRAKKAATVEHIARCWHNPDNRTCKTCVHFDPGGDACGCEPGCNWGSSGPVGPSCNATGQDLDFDQLPVTNCPKWEATS
ncbi:hypothetical protein ABT010_13275 [Streptomyces sp. NPDC002668]|uniref:hypothetical protein n=1 Tax=Streptomyces sp. NPDC002668 TaxID=3154422 RepID=UPI00332837E5